MKLSERALEKFPPNWAQGVDLNADKRLGYEIAFEEAIALAAEKSEEMGRHVKGGYNNAAAQIADEIRALASEPPPGACL